MIVGVVLKSLCFVLLLVAVCRADDNLQRWSITTKMGDSVTLKCEDSFGNIQVTTSESLVWKKKDHHNKIQNDDVYTLTADSGLADKHLHFNASGATNGIYFCEVTNTKNTADASDDELVGVIAKGVNVGVYEYKDFLDEYERNLIVGAIAAGSVFVLVVSIGLVSSYQYESEEERSDRLHHKTNYRKRKEHHNMAPHNGYDNSAVTMDEMPRKNDNMVIYPEHVNVNTAF